MIRKMILDLLYPPVCMICGRLLSKTTGVCRECFGKLQWIKDPRCMCCGKPLHDERQEYCPECEGIRREFTAGIGVFPYRSIIRQAVLDLKDHGKKVKSTFLSAFCRLKHPENKFIEQEKRDEPKTATTQQLSRCTSLTSCSAYPHRSWGITSRSSRRSGALSPARTECTIFPPSSRSSPPSVLGGGGRGLS